LEGDKGWTIRKVIGGVEKEKKEKKLMPGKTPRKLEKFVQRRR